MGASTKNELRDDLALLLLRVAFGGAMLSHGVPKLMAFGERADSFPDPIGLGSPVALALAVFAEVFCAAGVAIGLLTRLAVIPLIVTMGVAALVIHGDDPFGKKELPLLYLSAYVAIGIMGAGRFSVDRFLPERLAKLR
jgi:putative oxidoreductase